MAISAFTMSVFTFISKIHGWTNVQMNVPSHLFLANLIHLSNATSNSIAFSRLHEFRLVILVREARNLRVYGLFEKNKENQQGSGQLWGKYCKWYKTYTLDLSYQWGKGAGVFIQLLKVTGWGPLSRRKNDNSQLRPSITTAEEALSTEM